MQEYKGSYREVWQATYKGKAKVAQYQQESSG